MGNLLTNDVMLCYDEAMREVKSNLSELLKEFILDYPSFGFYICGRTKAQDRTEEKLKRKYPNVENYDKNFIVNNVTDIAGVRIIFGPVNTSFDISLLNMTLRGLSINNFEKLMQEAKAIKDNNSIDIIYNFVDTLRASGFNIILNKTKDYISNPKESGYMSYHVTVVASNGFPVEIQLRNFLQHLYAEAEHMRYEGIYNDTARNDILRECASYLKPSNEHDSNVRSL